MSKELEIVSYIRLHLLSLCQDEQDAINNVDLLDDSEYYPSEEWYEGAIETARHLLSVAEDILNK